MLVPSLINPPRILDLDEEVSLTGAIARMGRRCCCSTGAKRTQRPELERRRPYRAIAAAVAAQHWRAGGADRLLPRRDDGDRGRQPRRRASASSRSPRRGISAHYPESSRRALQDMWRHSQAAAAKRSARCRWRCCRRPSGRSIPSAPCSKFAEFGRLDPASADARRFVELEEWANEGEALPYPAAKELIEELFGEDRRARALAGRRAATVTDELDVPTLHLTADARPHRAGRNRAGGTVRRDRLRPCRDDRRLGARPAPR